MVVDEETGPDGAVVRAGQEYYLKAMNCPMHNLVFRSRGRSYRELPMRLFEMGRDYRYEKSGVVHGLTRMRGFTQDDSHTYCTPEQAPDEIGRQIDFFTSRMVVFWRACTSSRSKHWLWCAAPDQLRRPAGPQSRFCIINYKYRFSFFSDRIKKT